MAVYSVTLPNEIIIKRIKGIFTKILIVGCGGCTNESLAYTNNWAICDHSQDQIGLATARELERIEALLFEKGFEVRYTSVPLGMVNAFCIRYDGDQFDYNTHVSFFPDLILALCCAAGTFGLMDDLRVAGLKIPVYQITRQVGLLSYFYYVKEDKRWIDYSRSKAIRISTSKIDSI